MVQHGEAPRQIGGSAPSSSLGLDALRCTLFYGLVVIESIARAADATRL